METITPISVRIDYKCPRVGLLKTLVVENTNYAIYPTIDEDVETIIDCQVCGFRHTIRLNKGYLSGT